MRPFSCSSLLPLPFCLWQQLKQPISLKLLFNTRSSTRHCFETVTSVCRSVCNLQRLRLGEKKTNPERHNDGQRDIKYRWRRDIESSQKEKDLRRKQFVRLHNGWTQKWKWSLCSAKGESLFMGRNYHYIRPQLFSCSSFRLSSISHRQKSPISSHIHNQ